MRLRTTRERFRSGSTRQPRGYEESRQGVVKYQYFSTPGNEKYFRRFALFRSRLDGSSEQLSLLEPGRSKSNEFSLCETYLLFVLQVRQCEVKSILRCTFIHILVDLLKSSNPFRLNQINSNVSYSKVRNAHPCSSSVSTCTHILITVLVYVVHAQVHVCVPDKNAFPALPSPCVCVTSPPFPHPPQLRDNSNAVPEHFFSDPFRTRTGSTKMTDGNQKLPLTEATYMYNVQSLYSVHDWTLTNRSMAMYNVLTYPKGIVCVIGRHFKTVKITRDISDTFLMHRRRFWVIYDAQATFLGHLWCTGDVSGSFMMHRRRFWVIFDAQARFLGHFWCTGDVSGSFLMHRRRFWVIYDAQATFLGHFWCTGDVSGSFMMHRRRFWVIYDAQATFLGHFWCTGDVSGSFMMHRRRFWVIFDAQATFLGHFWCTGDVSGSFLIMWPDTCTCTCTSKRQGSFLGRMGALWRGSPFPVLTCTCNSSTEFKVWIMAQIYRIWMSWIRWSVCNSYTCTCTVTRWSLMTRSFWKMEIRQSQQLHASLALHPSPTCKM